MEKKRKAVLLPLDERPCNFKFPYQLFQTDFMEVVRPECLGDKKIPADLKMVENFLLKECCDADYAVIALDTLLYGGLIPSRLHHFEKNEVIGRLEILKKIKQNNPSLNLYAFACIMRCPKYSSSDEEPDYYEDCGAEIHRLGAVLHQEKLSLKTTDEKDVLLEKIPEAALRDYTERRAFNLSMNLRTVDMVKDGIIDFLIIPQDDSAPFGYTAMDQSTVRGYIADKALQNQIYIYPGADEVEMTLLARAVNHCQKKTPRVYAKYASMSAPFLTPPYEDRPLGETVKSHLMAAGCLQTDSLSESDFVLGLTAPSECMEEAVKQPVNKANYTTARNLAEFVYAVKTYIKEGKAVSIADNSYVNGGDLELLQMLEEEKLLFHLAGYAGWNTSANTIGTSIAEGVLYLYRGNSRQALDFLTLRYFEDVGYCAHVRKCVTEEELPQLGMNYFDVREAEGIVSRIVEKRLKQFMAIHYPSVAEHTRVLKVRMPWRRMFEVDIEAEYCGDDFAPDSSQME